MMSKFLPNSFQIPNALIDELIADISPNALKCYLVIVRKTVGWSKEWDYIPTTQLMELTGIKKKQTVYTAIAELEELGLIEALKETGKTTKYRLKLVPGKVVTKNGTSIENSNEVVPKIDTGTSTENGYPSKDNSKIQYTKEKINKKDFDLDVIEGEVFKENDLPQFPINRKIFADWIEYRKEIKKPITRISAKQQIKMLCCYSAKEQEEIINTSIQNGYQGLFEPKQQKQFNQPKSKVQKTNEYIDDFFERMAEQGKESAIDVEVLS